MFDWLKDILGDGYTEEIDKAISAKIGENFVSRSDFNAKNAAVKSLESQIKDRDTQLEELKEVDTKALQDEITKLQNDNKAAQKKYDADMERERLDAAINLGIVNAKGKNATAISALLNRENIKLSDDKKSVEGLKEELERIKKDADYLFTVEETGPVGTEQNTSGGSPAGGNPDEPPEDYDAYVAWRSKH